ncbi:MAG: glucosaminidase domain-containing protein [bacterium]|nr:glucosaminidase domain-containing protein [bacterium]
MKKRLMYTSLLLLSFFLADTVNALSAAEVSSRGTDCPQVELAEAKEDGSLNKISCYDTYQVAKQVMDTTDNDNLVIIEGKRIIDAKYAFIDYDQYASVGYTTIYDSKELSNNRTYIAGGNSDDAVFLELDYPTGRVKIKVAGVVGWIKRYENESTMQNVLYDIVPLSWVKSPSYYEITESEIVHHLPLNVYNTKGKYSIKIGRKPTMVATGNYYSFDGNYFYSDLKVMINDYKANHYTNSVNNNQPFYNYYQYLSFRSKSSYSASNINQYIDHRTSNPASKLKNTGDYFINSQNRYGVNAILMLAIGINESDFGNSPIAQTKNNLFGLNAVDASPGLSASVYLSVESCIDDFGFAWLAGRYLQPGDFRYNGAVVGNKSVGLNIKYASDPYWGEKAAAYYYDLDKYFGFQDYEKYTVAILNGNYNNTVYATKTPGGDNVSSSYYQYRNLGSSVIILGEVTGPSINGNTTWYKVTSDPVLDANLNYYSDSAYYNTSPRINYGWNSSLVYVPAAYFTKTYNGGSQIEDNNQVPVTPPEEIPTVTPTPNPVAKPINSIVVEAGYTYANGLISKIAPGTTIETIKNNLTNTGGTIIITDAVGNIVTSGEIGTGYRVDITSSTLHEVLNIVIYGDINGDGKINSADLLRMRQHLLGNTLTGVYERAAYMGYSSINSANLLKIRQYLLGTSNIDQN